MWCKARFFASMTDIIEFVIDDNDIPSLRRY